ncbi:hypothetical protein CPB86DRAFT_736422 [Serendipita vermifera]|nr:hypothetical protein CPB86DRAFT_736422 [Serendipita vermifera]
MSQGQRPPLPAPLKSPRTTHASTAVPFPNETSIWEVCINEAVLVDNELVKDWTSGLNFLLVFAAIFSSVLSAFIIESKHMLEQDPADVMVDALIFFINNTANGTHTPYPRASFSPPPYAVSVNALLFASLSASIVAALASVVALQWVAEYDAATSRSGSSPKDRVKRRQFRYGGMESWKMREIIAALPILLYCSLVLFFVGLAQWMWNVHTTVGGVVIGGMILGAAFYIITTLLAVVFPSSPYRAPIARWVYTLLRFILHPLASLKRVAGEYKDGTLMSKLGYKRLAQTGKSLFTLSTYRDYVALISSNFKKPTIQARDEARIEVEEKTLICESLSWLAKNISISQDSHYRLLLLTREALKLDEEQQQSKRFEEIPWDSIFRVLGARYAQHATSKELAADDERDLVVLLQCLRNPRIGSFISPPEDKEEYVDPVSGDDVDQLEAAGPNPVYLLLRKIERADPPLSIEEQVKLRVGCLNQAHRVPISPPTVKDFHTQLISKGTVDLCDYLIPQLAEELRSRPHDDAQDRMDTLICLAHLRRPPLQNCKQSVNLLLKGSEITIQNPSRLIYRLCCANWIESQIDHPHIHTILKALVATQKRNPSVKPLFRFIATDREVDEAVTLVDAPHRTDLYKHIISERKEPYLIETFETFDNIIASGCNGAQREVMVELLCHDLLNADPRFYKYYFTESVKGRILALKDHRIRFVGQVAAEMYEELDRSPVLSTTLPRALMKLLDRQILNNQDLDHVLSIWRLRMQLWHQLDHAEMTRIMEKALLDLVELRRLQNGFSQFGLGTDHGEDFLLRFIHSPFSTRVQHSSNRLIARYGRVPALLAHEGPGIFQLQSQEEGKTPKPECISYLLELCENVKRSPVRLTRLLTYLTQIDLEAIQTWVNPHLILDIHHILEVTTRHCSESGATPETTDRRELAHLLEATRDRIIDQWVNLTAKDSQGLMTPLGDKGTFKERCTDVIHGLRT